MTEPGVRRKPDSAQPSCSPHHSCLRGGVVVVRQRFRLKPAPRTWVCSPAFRLSGHPARESPVLPGGNTVVTSVGFRRGFWTKLVSGLPGSFPSKRFHGATVSLGVLETKSVPAPLRGGAVQRGFPVSDDVLTAHSPSVRGLSSDAGAANPRDLCDRIVGQDHDGACGGLGPRNS